MGLDEFLILFVCFFEVFVIFDLFVLILGGVNCIDVLVIVVVIIVFGGCDIVGVGVLVVDSVLVVYVSCLGVDLLICVILVVEDVDIFDCCGWFLLLCCGDDYLKKYVWFVLDVYVEFEWFCVVGVVVLFVLL